MKLKEVLVKYEGKKIRIGAASSFFYIGTCSEDIKEIITGHSIEEKKRLQELIKKNKYHKEHFKEYWEKTTKTRCKKAIEENKINEILDAVKKELSSIERDKENDKIRTDSNIEEYEKRYFDFIPYLERKVVDIYESEENKDIIIIIEGKENGDFWFEKEYQRATKKKEKAQGDK